MNLITKLIILKPKCQNKTQYFQVKDINININQNLKIRMSNTDPQTHDSKNAENQRQGENLESNKKKGVTQKGMPMKLTADV